MNRHRGFTLLEMLIVIVIIVIIAGAAVVMSGTLMGGAPVRGGATIVIQTVARAKQLSANQKVMHFIVFINAPDGGRMEIHKDANGNGLYEGDAIPGSNDPDPVVENETIDLPKFCEFEKAPLWMGFNPSGYVVFSTGTATGGPFSEVQAGTFDGAMAASQPNPVGDVIVHEKGESYRVCMDVDRASGKVRRHQFLAQ